jgi:hypothetical protein
MRKTNSEYCKAARARRKAQGLCIWACGRKATRGCGLCNHCAKKSNAKMIARYAVEAAMS